MGRMHHQIIPDSRDAFFLGGRSFSCDITRPFALGFQPLKAARVVAEFPPRFCWRWFFSPLPVLS